MSDARADLETFVETMSPVNGRKILQAYNVTPVPNDHDANRQLLIKLLKVRFHHGHYITLNDFDKIISRANVERLRNVLYRSFEEGVKYYEEGAKKYEEEQRKLDEEDKQHEVEQDADAGFKFPVKYIDELSASPFQSKINSIKATIEKQYRKLQQALDQEKAWKESQEVIAKQQDDYNEAYAQFYATPTDANGQAPLPEKRMREALKQPLGTPIMLHNLTFDDREKMGALLKEFYENNIKTLSLDTKVLVHYYVNGSWIIKPLDNANVRTSLEKMLAGDYNFTCDELETIGSDVDAKFSLSFIDGIKFTKLDKKEKKDKTAKTDDEKNAKKTRSNHASAFFPYRLTQEYKLFKAFTRRLAIGCCVYSYKHKCPKQWIQKSCFVYAVEQLYPNEKQLITDLSRMTANVKYISSDKLSEIGFTLSMSIILRSVDNADAVIRKGNKANGGVYGPTSNYKYKIEIARYEQHYFIYVDLPVSRFFVKNFKEVFAYGTKQGWTFEKMCLAYERRGNGFKTNTKKAHMSSLDLVIELMNVGAFTPLMRNDRDVDLACVQEWTSKDTNDTLSVNSYNMRIIKPQLAKQCAKNLLNEDELANYAKDDAKHDAKDGKSSYWYADFETCTREFEFKGVKTGREVAFMVCLQSEDGSIAKTFSGSDCAEQLLEFLPNKSIVYFHNLGFDGRLLMKYNTVSNIMKGSKIICQKQCYKGKRITFNDSYSLLPQALRTFPASFKKEFAGLNIQKELFPYRYYNYARVNAALNGEQGVIADVGKDELPVWTEAQLNEFIDNCDKIGAKRNGGYFDMIKYCEFYCQQDVNVLRIGFNAFRESAIKPPIEIDIHTVKTAPSLANEYLLKNVFYPNGQLYEYSGTLQDYIQGAVYGGRCMTKQNKRWKVEGTILDDFDACSLYPSAMARMFTVEGKPCVIKDSLIDDNVYSEEHPHYLLQHAFTEEQLEADSEHYISQIIVDIDIVKVGVERDFPLIVERIQAHSVNTPFAASLHQDEANEVSVTGTSVASVGNHNVNKCVSMRVDLIALQDLAHFQKIEYKVKRGLMWTGKRDHSIQQVIRRLFEQRAQYKKEGNSIQQVIKLIMNSGYGKSIQKPIKTDNKFVAEDKFEHYVEEHYHNIECIKKVDESDKYIVNVRKSLDKQFNNCLFGVTVLSMSKRIMNEVMCLAEDLNIPIYYQDTDSMHIEHDKLQLLADTFKQKYGRELIGENIMGRFHNDFDELPDAYCTFHLSLGKKMYYDALENAAGQHAEHFRMKGIPNDVIKDYANKNFNGNVRALYEYLYEEGNNIEFDLLSTKVSFQMEKTGEIVHKQSFNRRVRATAPQP